MTIGRLSKYAARRNQTNLTDHIPPSPPSSPRRLNVAQQQIQRGIPEAMGSSGRPSFQASGGSRSIPDFSLYPHSEDIDSLSTLPIPPATSAGRNPIHGSLEIINFRPACPRQSDSTHPSHQTKNHSFSTQVLSTQRILSQYDAVRPGSWVSAFTFRADHASPPLYHSPGCYDAAREGWWSWILEGFSIDRIQAKHQVFEMCREL